MTAVDTLIADLNGTRFSARAQPIVVSVDDMIAALQQLQTGGVTGPAGGDLSGTYPNPVVAKIQGQPISAAVPAANNVLTFSGGQWAPAPAATPVVVQDACVCVANMALGITLATPPVQGNILIAMTTDQTSNETAAAGWQLLGQSGATAADGTAAFWKQAGAAESATQVPVATAHQGTISIWEVSTGCPGVPTFVTDTASSTAQAIAGKQTKAAGGILLGMCCVRTAAVVPSSIVGAVQGQTATGVGRSVANFVSSTPGTPTQAITVNYATAKQGALTTVSCA